MSSRKKNNKQIETQTLEFKEKLIIQLKEIHKNKKEKLIKQYKLQTNSIKNIEEEIIEKISKKEKLINEMRKRIDKINKYSKELEKSKQDISSELKILKKSIYNKLESERKKAKLRNCDINKELKGDKSKLINKVNDFKPVSHSLNKLKS